VIGFSLPQLLGKMGGLIPRMEQKVPAVDQVVNRVEQLVEDSMTLPKLENKLLEIELEDPFEDILETPRMSSGLVSEEFFGRKDDDVEPFHGLVNGFMSGFMDKILKSLPSQANNLRSFSPFGSPVHHTGQMTIIKAGPGFREEQHFDIGPDGELVEQEHFKQDALEHENPMDTHFDFNDVEVFHDNDEDIAKIGDVEIMGKNDSTESDEDSAEGLVSEPVMDVRMVEEHEKLPVEEPEKHQKLVKEEEEKEVKDTEAGEKQIAAVEAQAQEFPFLSVLRNTVAENERLSQELLSQFQEYHRSRGWGDDNTCSNHHMKWSDWVACLHQKTGIPRWLTAATISLGIIFSVWLCLVIPTSAPKQKLRALVIKKADKPSVAAAKAKEAEASAVAKAKEAEASLSVSVVTVDMPPTYTPGSPAPSYKSDMAAPVVPGSPAPSYRSVDIPAEGSKDKTVQLEPVEPAVHGEDKKESVA